MRLVFAYQKSFRNWHPVCFALLHVRDESDEVRLRRVALLQAADGHDVSGDTTHLKENDYIIILQNCCIVVFDKNFV